MRTLELMKSYKKTKLIFNSYLAKQLVLNGFQIIDLIKNKKDSDLIVFVFEETDELLNAITELTQ